MRTIIAAAAVTKQGKGTHSHDDVDDDDDDDDTYSSPTLLKTIAFRHISSKSCLSDCKDL